MGTIKQRSAQTKPSIVSVDTEGGAGGERNIEVNSEIFEETGTMKRNTKAQKREFSLYIGCFDESTVQPCFS